MKEYIERAAAIDIIKTAGFWEEEDGEVAITCVEQTHAADVVEVRHGRWERNSPDDIVVYCSQCMMPQDAPSNYCPSCGARMDKEDEHEIG